jgi:tripartite ATP-independent transporter DctM subunit
MDKFFSRRIIGQLPDQEAAMPNDAVLMGDADVAAPISGAADATAVSRAVVRASHGLGYVAGAGIAFLCLATVYDVLARYIFNAPTAWATEISTYVLIATVFFGAGQTHLIGGHVRVELLLNRLRGAALQTTLLTVAWLAFLVVAISAWQATLMVLSDYRNGSRIFSLLLTPTWMPKLPIAVGLSMLAAAMLVEIERLGAPQPAWRRRATWAVALLLLATLLAFGTSPPTLGDTRFDAGSLAVLLVVWVGAWVSGGWRVLAGVLFATVGGFCITYLAQDFGLGVVGTLLGVAIVAVLAVGVRIAFALGFVGLLAIYFLTPVPFPLTVADRTWSSVNSFSLTAVPMFVLMGSLLVRSGLSRELFAVMARLLGWLPGGLGHAATAGCGLFAAVSGSSVATAATIGGVACPEMIRRGYSPGLTYGTVAAGGTLGILIPPSVPMIIYGTAVGVPVSTLFIAGIVPGVLMMLAFSAVILAWTWLRPGAAPSVNAAALQPLHRGSFIDTGLILLMIAGVVLALYLGVATPSETGAVGAMLAFLACAVRRRMSWTTLRESLSETVAVTSFILLIVVGANILTFGFDYLKVSQALMEMATAAAVDRWLVMLVIMAVYVVLGMFLDSISMLVLTLPVVFPLATSLGFDPVWLGIVLVITAEVGLITPPVGMNLFVLQGISQGSVSMRTIALGSAPFLGAMLGVIALLCMFPDIALLLTRHLQ